jgi:integrase
MASTRVDSRKDGTSCTRVFFREDGKQRCLTFDDHAVALRFKDLVTQVGATRAQEIAQIERKPRHTRTVADVVKHHIDHLSGVDPRTIAEYRGILRNDIADKIGAIPVAALSRDDVSDWVKAMRTKGAKAKTIANKHALLSAALAAAVEAHDIPSNPAAGTGLYRDERTENVFLERDEFARLIAEIPETWRPLVEFLAVSGCRWSEATALKPGDVDRVKCTVRISRSWRRGGGGFRIGPTKTRKSNRTINVPKTVLDKLDYSHEWLFTNPGEGKGGPSPLRRGAGLPVRAPSFRRNVWYPATARAKLSPRPRIHDLRHTCASWLIAAGRPLPAVQQHLGHESIQTTIEVYTHLDRSSGQGNADALAAMLDFAGAGVATPSEIGPVDETTP